jgi:hypothetical protein
MTLGDPLEDIIDIYDSVVTKERGIFSQSIVESVTVPTFGPSHLQTLLTIAQIDLSQGGSFAGCCNLSLQVVDLIVVLKIFCE